MVSTVKVTNITTPDGTGNVTFDRPLSGSGASLTSLPAANLTGTLPALDGSALTGVGVDGITSSANATAISISANEEVTMPLQPAFQVQHSGTQSNVTGASATYTLLWDTETFDIGSNFASNTFTAPITGKYLLTANVTFEGVTSASDGFDLQIVTSNRTYQTSEHLLGDMSSQRFQCLAVVADMDASDTAIVRTIGTGESGNVWDIGGVQPKFSGALLA
jgi:hypothetical protein